MFLHESDKNCKLMMGIYLDKFSIQINEYLSSLGGGRELVTFDMIWVKVVTIIRIWSNHCTF